MHQTSLSEEELDAILPLLDSICAEHTSVENQRLVEMAPQYAHELPLRVRQFFSEFRIAEPSALCILSGFPVDDEAIGPTPASWSLDETRSSALRQEVFFLLCATLLGDVFARATQPDGRIMPDLVPGKAGQDEPVATSLSWRTEDASSPFKADYIGLMCLRNPDNVATTICDADWIDWSRIDVDLLFTADWQLSDMPVLFGDRGRPYLALDPASIVRDTMTPATRAAFDAFTRAIDDALQGFVPWPGDIAYIDNLRAVHGQEPFDARHDGTDRWLRRLTISRNVRASRSASGTWTVP